MNEENEWKKLEESESPNLKKKKTKERKGKKKNKKILKSYCSEMKILDGKGRLKPFSVIPDRKSLICVSFPEMELSINR